MVKDHKAQKRKPTLKRSSIPLTKKLLRQIIKVKQIKKTNNKKLPIQSLYKVTQCIIPYIKLLTN